MNTTMGMFSPDTSWCWTPSFGVHTVAAWSHLRQAGPQMPRMTAGDLEHDHYQIRVNNHASTELTFTVFHRLLAPSLKLECKATKDHVTWIPPIESKLSRDILASIGHMVFCNLVFRFWIEPAIYKTQYTMRTTHSSCVTDHLHNPSIVTALQLIGNIAIN